MKKIAYITNAKPQSGVGHRAEYIDRLIRQQHASEISLSNYTIDGNAGVLWEGQRQLFSSRKLPGVLGSKTVSWLSLGFRLRRYLDRFPDTIWHATNQTVSFIISSRHPAVVTVHDLIELLEPQTRFGGIAAQYLYSGIKRAAHIIAVSEYTAQTIIDRLGISESKISIIHNGVGPEFHPISDFSHSIGAHSLRQKLGIGAHQKVVLYVGSDHPRKNVVTALQAVAAAKANIPELLFLKVGEAGLRAGRVALLQEIDQLQMRDHVHLLGQVSVAELNELYNLADVFLYPSRFEGFGLPPLQAMAAGLPVITSNSTSLPEVVGDAAITHDPNDVEAYATSLHDILSDPTKADALRQRGLIRAKEFSWADAAAAEVEVYKKL